MTDALDDGGPLVGVALGSPTAHVVNSRATTLGPADAARRGDLGWQLYLAGELIPLGLGTRVVYTTVGGYDTHQGHAYTAEANLAQLDAAVTGFLDRAEAGGFADQVLVASFSEFGRRVPENGSGLDHGNASTMLPGEPRPLGLF